MLVEDSARCPQCQFEFILEGDRGECPACGNIYTQINGMDDGPDGCKSFSKLYWDYGETTVGTKSFEVKKDSKNEKCPECGILFDEVISESIKFYIIRKRCSQCSRSDEEIIRKETSST